MIEIELDSGRGAEPCRALWLHWRELDIARLYALLQLRSEVFVVEQQCAFLDMDGLDQHCEHLFLLDPVDDSLLGCARLVPPGVKYEQPSIGRVVIAPRARGRDLGRALMREAVRHCLRRYPDQGITIGAQQHLSRFYGELDFVQTGDAYLEDDIWHIDMRREASLPVP